MRLPTLLLFVALACGCATTKGREGKDAPRCPESSALKCLSAEVCSYDSGRGCRVCQCDNGGFTPLNDAMNPRRPGPP